MSDQDNQQPETGEVKLYPIWFQAVSDSLEAFNYGDVIPFDWLYEHLEINTPNGRMTADEHRAIAFDLLTKIDGFRSILLEEHQRMTINVRGFGYQIVEPQHQTDAAMRKFRRDFYKSWGKAMNCLTNINESMITLEDARANAEAKAKLAWFRTIGVKKIEDKSE